MNTETYTEIINPYMERLANCIAVSILATYLIFIVSALIGEMFPINSPVDIPNLYGSMTGYFPL
jgi:hypothetical protein